MKIFRYIVDLVENPQTNKYGLMKDTADKIKGIILKGGLSLRFVEYLNLCLVIPATPMSQIVPVYDWLWRKSE
jgi:hypothetical protein